MHLADAFVQSDLQFIQAIHFSFISMCVPWELNLGIQYLNFALLTQCSTTEPQEHDMLLYATSLVVFQKVSLLQFYLHCKTQRCYVFYGIVLFPQ